MAPSPRWKTAHLRHRREEPEQREAPEQRLETKPLHHHGEEPAHLRGAPEQRQEPVHRALQTWRGRGRGRGRDRGQSRAPEQRLNVGVRDVGAVAVPLDMEGCPYLC